MITVLITAFIIGVAVGIAVHRLLIAIITESSPDSVCARCKLQQIKEENRLFTKRRL